MAAKRPDEGLRAGGRMKRDPDSVRRAREMRKNPSRAEEKLWSLLRDRRLIKRKFRRQHPIGPWVADFACPAIHLVIEVDGPSHDTEDQKVWDEMKEEYLRQNGWRLVRIRNEAVSQAFGEVEAEIIAAIGD